MLIDDLEFIDKLDLSEIFSLIDLAKMDDLDKEKRKEKQQQVMQILSKMVQILKEIFEDKIKYMTWTEIISLYHKDKDIMRRYALLHEIITKKNICKDARCPIFPPLLDIGLDLDALPVHDLESAKEYYGIRSPDYTKFVSTLSKINQNLTLVFEDIFKLSAVDSAIEEKVKKAHKRSITTIEKLGKAQIPFQNKELAKSVDQSIRIDESVLTADDLELKKNYDIFNKQDNKQNEKRKKSSSK